MSTEGRPGQVGRGCRSAPDRRGPQEVFWGLQEVFWGPQEMFADPRAADPPLQQLFLLPCAAAPARSSALDAARLQNSRELERGNGAALCNEERCLTYSSLEEWQGNKPGRSVDPLWWWRSTRTFGRQKIWEVGDVLC